MPELIVRTGGPMSTVQDEGRPGHAHLGVPPSGALDRPAFATANRLVGNPSGAAAVETTFGGLSVHADRPITVAVTGAIAPVRVDDRPRPMNTAIRLHPGELLALGPPAKGLRNYLAVAGGIAVPTVFGSRSTDLLSGLGPPLLVDGMRLPVGDSESDVDRTDAAPARELPAIIQVRLHPGPRQDWFAADSISRLFSTDYSVSTRSNRVGVRLDGAVMRRSVDEELPSEGVVTGAVEVPADGQPLIFLADHPTTGGYPVVGVVDYDDLPLLGQARPGTTLRFVEM